MSVFSTLVNFVRRDGINWAVIKCLAHLLGKFIVHRRINNEENTEREKGVMLHGETALNHFFYRFVV